MNPLRLFIEPIRHARRRRSFAAAGGSSSYWQTRYERGGTSGAGSYGELAKFKARTLNDFVERNAVASVVEFGCGDGNQLDMLNYPRYLGLDVAPAAVAICLQKFESDGTKSFMAYDSLHFSDSAGFISAEMSTSIDVIFHLVEDDVFDKYMNDLFSSGTRFVCVYSSNESLKDPAAHVRHRRFTDWVATNASEWSLLEKVDNPLIGKTTGAIADFYFYGLENRSS